MFLKMILHLNLYSVDESSHFFSLMMAGLSSVEIQKELRAKAACMQLSSGHYDKLPPNDFRDEVSGCIKTKKLCFIIIFYSFIVYLHCQAQGSEDRCPHFHHSHVNLLRHFHICSELSKCVITSLWELFYHNRERAYKMRSWEETGEKLTLCRNFN